MEGSIELRRPHLRPLFAERLSVSASHRLGARRRKARHGYEYLPISEDLTSAAKVRFSKSPISSRRLRVVADLVIEPAGFLRPRRSTLSLSLGDQEFCCGEKDGNDDQQRDRPVRL